LPESAREAHGTATLSCVVDLAAAAAFTAAGLSLVNVAISARLTSRGHREQWRREQERPIVARCLTVSADALSEWWDASVAKQDADADSPGTWVDPHWDTGRQLLRDLRFEIAQLDLLASRTVRQAASALEMAHDKERRRLLLQARPGQGDYEGRRTARVKIKELQSALLEGARTDLGLGLGMQVPPRSLLARLLGRPSV
jgi:hypothetical protein